MRCLSLRHKLCFVLFFVFFLLSPAAEAKNRGPRTRARLGSTSGPAAGQPAPPESQSASLVDRVGQTGFLQLYSESFKNVPLREKIVAYWLCMAAIAIHPIVFDQNSVYGLREKHLLEQVLKHPAGIESEPLKKITAYTKLFWANRGNHNTLTSRKFLPEFSLEELRAAAQQAMKNGAPIGPLSKLDRELEELRRAVFDPAFEPMLTVKNPPKGKDPLEASSNNLYQGVRTSDLLGFYRAARGMEGASQAFVPVVNAKMDKLMKDFVDNAAYFEQHAPWDDKYKLGKPYPPLARAVEALIETGDFEVNTIGENLPNETEIHDNYGSKSFIFTGSTRALNHATGDAVTREFAYSPEEIERAVKYRELADDLITTMHEIIGHGSGKMNPRLTREPAYYIKEYYSTLEETRADLMALWNLFDPKLIEMGAVPNLEAAKAVYDREARAALVQLREVPTGDTIEEDHRRGTQLIINYVRDKTGAIEPVEREGKTYLVVKDYDKMRQGVGMLLAELMRIK